MLRRRSLIAALLAGLFLAGPLAAQAGAAPTQAPQLVERDFWSQSLGVRKRVVVWLPPSYATSPSRRYPVAYYLHGVHGSERDWTRQGGMATVADSLMRQGMGEFLVVMPDGDDGWYTTWNSLGDYPGCRRDFVPRNGDSVDSYCVPWLHYDDYVAHDLVQFVDKTWRTQPRRERRAVAGLSMGGYGAVVLALQYPDVFSVAASHSGTLSPLLVSRGQEPVRYAGSVDELRAPWGALFPGIRAAFGPDTTGWWSRDPSRLARQLKSSRAARMPALMLDAGVDDPYLRQTRAFRSELQQLGVAHAYAEWPGTHDWKYWRGHVAESLRFIATRIAP